jgi:hypothetical protein
MTTLVWVPGRRTLHRRDCPVVAGRLVVDEPSPPGYPFPRGSVAAWPHSKREWLGASGRAALCRRCKP